MYNNKSYKPPLKKKKRLVKKWKNTKSRDKSSKIIFANRF